MTQKNEGLQVADVCRISGLLDLVWSVKASLQWSGCHQRSLHLLWFQSRCARVSGITWGSLSLLAGPAALLKQVPNDYKIRFGQFIITTWTCTLVNPLPFILKLSALIYLIGVTDEEALTRRPSPLLPASLPPTLWGPALALSPALTPHVYSSIRRSLLLLCTSAHWTQVNLCWWWAEAHHQWQIRRGWWSHCCETENGLQTWLVGHVQNENTL